MLYYDDIGRRIRRPVRRSTASSKATPTAADIHLIRQVAAENRGFTPDQVHAEICNNRGRPDITKGTVRQVLA